MAPVDFLLLVRATLLYIGCFIENAAHYHHICFKVQPIIPDRRRRHGFSPSKTPRAQRRNPPNYVFTMSIVNIVLQSAVLSIVSNVLAQVIDAYQKNVSTSLVPRAARHEAHLLDKPLTKYC